MDFEKIMLWLVLFEIIIWKNVWKNIKRWVGHIEGVVYWRGFKLIPGYEYVYTYDIYIYIYIYTSTYIYKK